MKEDCRNVQDQFVDALYNELSGSDRELLGAHLDNCPACQASYHKMQKTLRLMGERSHADPGGTFWKQLSGNIDARLNQELSGATPAAKNPLKTALHIPFPTWALQAAAVAATLLLGIYIGSSLFIPGNPDAPAIIVADSNPGAVESVDLQAAHYIEKSKLIIKGMVNLDAGAGVSEDLDISYQRRLSGEMVREAANLKAQLDDPKQRRVRQLIEDLELILVQIANLDNEYNLNAIEVVKQGVERKDILFKINIEEMRRLRDRVSEPTVPTAKVEI